MAFARVVTFEGVGQDRIDMLKERISSGERPPEVPASEIILLYDSSAQKSTVIVFFETEDDYNRGDQALSAMPADDTPGQRTSIGKFEVVGRATG
jgi:hypothetical protein